MITQIILLFLLITTFLKLKLFSFNPFESFFPNSYIKKYSIIALKPSRRNLNAFVIPLEARYRLLFCIKLYKELYLYAFC